MKIIINNILPPKGFKCINLFGILFCRRIPNKIDINHETIHTKQMQELLYIFFYLWYVIEYLVKFSAASLSKLFLAQCETAF